MLPNNKYVLYMR